ncbi:MAG: hypothetical protein JXQ83_15340 [Candidatus Glassbacteria bacterium]|nr:hypothetical protein [Candidatus Glassbacteria bacterium]
MAAPIKTVSDALIARLASQVAGLNTRTVATFAGSVGDFVGQGRNVPFVGVSLDKVRYGELNSDSSIAEERLSFQLRLIAEDFRGRGYSIENSYGLIDGIRDCLLGQTLEIEGLAPVVISGVVRDEVSEKQGLAVYTVGLETWQVRSRS